MKRIHQLLSQFILMVFAIMVIAFCFRMAMESGYLDAVAGLCGPYYGSYNYYYPYDGAGPARELLLLQ